MTTVLAASPLQSISAASGEDDSLPCETAAAACVDDLTARAVAGSLEVRVIDDTLRLARRRGWTDYISANAFNPLTLALQLARNAAGGGDVQQRKLSIKQLQLRRSEVVASLRSEVSGLLTRIAGDQRKHEQARVLFDAQRALVAVLEVGYRSGELSTERMMLVWEKLDFFRVEMAAAKADEEAARESLRRLIRPSSSETLQR